MYPHFLLKATACFLCLRCFIKSKYPWWCFPWCHRGKIYWHLDGLNYVRQLKPTQTPRLYSAECSILHQQIPRPNELTRQTINFYVHMCETKYTNNRESWTVYSVCFHTQHASNKLISYCMPVLFRLKCLTAFIFALFEQFALFEFGSEQWPCDSSEKHE